MFSSIFITTLITAVTGNFVRTTPMCQDFLCQNADINSETFRICQQIGCYNEDPRTYPPPINFPPGNYPPINFPPGNYPPINFPPGNIPPVDLQQGNYPPIDFPPSNYRPVNFPPVNTPPVNTPPANFAPGNTPPVNFPPVNFPPGNTPPVNFAPGNTPPVNFPPVNFPPGNTPPVNFAPGNTPPVNFPPVNFPPGNTPVNFAPGNTPPVNFPPVNFPPGNTPPGNTPPVGFPPVNFPPGNTLPGNTPPVGFPPVNFPPGNTPPGNTPPVGFPPVNSPSFPFMTSTPNRGSVPPYYNPGPFSPPATSSPTFPPQAFPPAMFPPVLSMPTPATYPNNMFPGPYSPPVMQPPVPFAQQAPATGTSNMLPPYYGYYPSYPWYHHSRPAPHVNIPAPIKEEAANLTYFSEEDNIWLRKGFKWPGWQVVSSNTTELQILRDDVDRIVKNAGQSWKVEIKNHFKRSDNLRMITNLNKDFNKCKCLIALTKWFEAVGLSPDAGASFENWLNNVANSRVGDNLNSNIWNPQQQHQQQFGYNPSGFYANPYQMYPYPMNNPHYFSSNPYAPNTNNLYDGNWPLSISYPLTSGHNSLFGTIYPNGDQTYPSPPQHQWPASHSYENNKPYFAAASQSDDKPVALTQKISNNANTNVSVTFDLRQFNVSKCISKVTLPNTATLEELLKAASEINPCFIFSTVTSTNNPLREGKYLKLINGIPVSNYATWIISQRNGAADLNLNFKPQTGDYIVINNVSV